MFVPAGFAHGFLALSKSVDFIYKCTDFYAPTYERTLRWDDPSVGIKWPLPTDAQPLLAQRDADAPVLNEVECYP